MPGGASTSQLAKGLSALMATGLFPRLSDRVRDDGTYVKGIKVVYGDRPQDRPGDAVTEADGASDNINEGKGGKFVWIVPEYTNKRSEACTSFCFELHDNAMDNMYDLAKGAGGKYRYLFFHKVKSNEKKIRKLYLVRSKMPVLIDRLVTGYTADLNDGRGGDYLCLAWKSV